MSHPMPQQVLTKAKPISLTQMYESDDLRILRNAILTEYNLKLDKDGLVVYRDNPTVPYVPFQKLKGETSQPVTYIATPLCIGELNGLLDTVFKALIQTKPAQILFSYRMVDTAHWVTGQIVINDLNIKLFIYDSATIYEKDEIEDKLKEILSFDLLSMTRFVQKRETIPSGEHSSILNKIFGKDGINKILFQNHGLKKIYTIQTHGLYCGGYSTRLIQNLVLHPAADIKEEQIWCCMHKSEQQLREEDLALVQKHCNSFDIKIFNSRARGDEYIAAQENQRKEKDLAFQKKEKADRRGGGSTQQMVVKQQFKSVQRSERAHAFRSKSSLTEDIVLKEVEGISRKAIERLPDLPDIGHNICWYYSHEGCLEYILEDIAKGRQSCKKFTKKDLEYVVKCGRIESISSSVLSLTNSSQKIVKLSIKILSYLSQNECKLSNEAIKLLIEKIDDMDNKIKQSATIALIYAINNDQSISGTKTVEIAIVAKLRQNITSLFLEKEQSLQLHIPEILAGFAALTKKGIKLSPKELDVLKKSLEYVGTELYTPVFPKTIMRLESHPKSRISMWRTTLQELRFLKNIIKKGELLNREELKWSIQSWEDNTKTKNKGKAIQIIRHSVVNRQRRYSEPDLLKKALIQALDYPDRKIQNNAIMAIGYLVHSAGKERNDYFSLRNNLNTSLSTSRQFGLSALTHHIQPIRKDSLPKTAEWLNILKVLQEDEIESISVAAKFIDTSLSGEIKILENLILDPNYAIKISLLFATAAKEKHPLSEPLLRKLCILLKNPETQYPFEAKYNALVILRHVAQNGQQIPSETLLELVNFCSQSRDYQVWEASLGTIGAYAKFHIKEVLNDKIISFLLNSLDLNINLKGTCFALKNIIQNLDDICFEKEFTKAINKITPLLGNVLHTSESRQAIALVLLHAAKKRFKFSAEILHQLADELIRKPSETILDILLETIKYLVEGAREINIPTILFENLIELFRHESETIKNDALYLVIELIGKVNTKLPASFFYSLAELLKNPLQACPASTILKKITECNVMIPTDILEILSELLAADDNSETALNAGMILKDKTNILRLTKKIHLNLFAAIDESRAEDILDCAILALKTIFEKNLQQEDLTKDIIIKLLSILQQNINTEQSLNIAALLLHSSLSGRSKRFDTRILIELKDLINDSSDKLCTTIIAILRLQMNKRHATQINHSPRQEIQEILLEIEGLSEEGEKLPEILLFYKEAIQHGYTLSCKTLDKVSIHLTEGLNKNVRDIAYTILKIHPKENLSKKVKAIYELETYGQMLEDLNKTRPEKISLMNSILELIKAGHLPSQNTLMTFAKILDNKHNGCLNEIIEILLTSAQNGSRIPLLLTEKLAYFLKDNTLDKTRIYILDLMIFLLNQRDCLPDIAQIIVEELIADISNQENALLYEKACLVFEVILQSTGKIAKKTYLQLINTLQKRSTTLQIAAAKLIYQANKVNHECANSFDGIVECLSIVTHRDSEKYLILAIKEIMLHTSIQASKRSITKLIEFLAKKPSFELEKPLIAIFEMISKTSKLPAEIKSLLELRKSEQTLLTSKSTELMAPLLILSKNAKWISKEGFLALEKLSASDDPAVIELLLSHLLIIQKEIAMPAHLLEKIGLLLNKDQFFNSVYEIAWESLKWQSLNLKPYFSLTFINQLLDSFITNSDAKQRPHIFALLEKIERSQTLPQVITNSLSFEREIYRIKKERKISPKNLMELLKMAHEQPKISNNSIKLFITLLNNKDPDSYPQILALLFQVKESIPLCLYDELFNTLVNLPFDKNSKEMQNLTLCQHLLCCHAFQPQKTSSLEKLYKIQISYTPFTKECKLLLIKIMDKLQDCNMGSIFDIVLDKLTHATNEKQQLELLELLRYTVARPFNVSANSINCILSYLSLLLKNTTSDLHKNTKIVRIIFIKLIAFLYRRNPENLTRINALIDIKKFISDISEHYQINDVVLEKINKMELTKKINLLLALKSSDIFDRELLIKEQDHLENCPRALMIAELLLKTKKNYRGVNFEATQKRFMECLLEFENSRKNDLQRNLERDNILYFLLERQEREQLSLQDIIETLIIIKDCKETILDYLAKIPSLRILCIQNSLQKIMHKSLWEEISISKLAALFFDTGWDIDCCNHYLNITKECKDPIALERFISFCIKHKIKAATMQFFLTDSYSRKAASDINQLRVLVHKELLNKIITEISDVMAKNKYIKDYAASLFKLDGVFLNRLMQLVAKNWDFEHILEFITKLKDRIVTGEFLNLDAVVSTFDTLYFYDFPPTELQNLEQLILSTPEAAKQYVIQKSLNTFFKKRKIREIPELIALLKKKNAENPQILRLLNSSKLIDIIQKSKKVYSTITHWEKIHIQNRVYELRSSAKDESALPEILALIRKAVKLELQWEPWDTQLFAVLLFLHSDSNKGRLIEIATGEGKSLIIAMLAVIRALQGEKVDIVTSQAELARRDSATYKKFFECFNFNVAENSEQHYTSGLKPCYAKEVHIIYGYINNFQFDLLREEFSGLNTRGGRGFDRVIVDEVDNLLIDEGAKIAMLASIMPGMENLKSLMLLITLHLDQLEQRFEFKDNILYFHEIIKNKPEPIKIRVHDKNKFLKAKMIETVNNILNNKFFMPEYLKELIKIQMEKWIESAGLAQLYQLKHQYKIKRDKYQVMSVVPVDYANTGSIQNGTTWGDGLHQCLQFKHGLESTVETLVVNFLSNMAFIKRYPHVNGVTGTIGSEEARKLLADPDNYNIDFAYMPEYNASQFREQGAQICENAADWLTEIEATVIREATNGRIVLVIAETIDDAEAIQN